MKIANDFRVGVPIEQAWELLTDIPGIAPCLPGAQLTGHEGDNYEGKIKIKVGPVTAEYKGSATITEMDEVNRRVLLEAKGRDSRGAGNASADITAIMTPDGDGTKVEIETDLKVSGKVAQFGRGVMGDVSKKLLGQFADCIEHKLASPESDAASVAAAGADAVNGAASGAVGAAAGAAGDVAGKAGDVAGAATGDVGDLAGAATGAAGDVAGAATGAVGGVAGAATGAAGDVAGKAGDAVSGVAGMGKGAAVAGAAGAAGAAAMVGGAAASAKAMMPGGNDGDDELEALDLLDIAGGSVAKRLVPLLIVIAVIVVILILVL